MRNSHCHFGVMPALPDCGGCASDNQTTRNDGIHRRRLRRPGARVWLMPQARPARCIAVPCVTPAFAPSSVDKSAWASRSAIYSLIVNKNFISMKCSLFMM